MASTGENTNGAGEAQPAAASAAANEGDRSTDSHITLAIKMSSQEKAPRFEISVPSAATVEDVKKAAKEKSGVEPSHQRLIYRGRVLKDADTLASHNVKDGHTIFLIRKVDGSAAGGGSGASQQQATSGSAEGASAPTSGSGTDSATTFIPPATAQGGLGGGQPNPFAALLGGAGGQPGFDMGALLSSLGGAGGAPGAAGAFGAGGLPGGGMPGGLNPQMFQTIMQNPMFQGMLSELMSNPEMLRGMMQSNPMLSQLSSQVPMLGTALNNPDVLRSILTPEMLQASMGLQQQMHQAQQQRTPATTPTPSQTTDMSSAPPAAATTQPTTAAAAAAAPGAAGAVPPQLSGFPPDLARSMQQAAQALEQNPALLQQLQSMMGGLAGGGAGGLAGLGAALGGAGGLGGGFPFAAPNATPADPRPAAERFAVQLGQLRDMGFIDNDANIAMLELAGGDVNDAIRRLLEGGLGN